MKPATYVDYTVKVGNRASMEEVSQCASFLMKALHAGFSEHKDKFALALPNLDESSPQKKISTFRVFAESMSDHMELHEFVTRSGYLDKHFVASFPKTVPEGFAGPYKAFTRIRIKSRAAGVQRLKKMLEVDTNGNAWINMQSRENGQRFPMYLQSHTAVAGTEGVLNGYGLSQVDNLLYLPHL
jgi:hypothetical protein